MLALFGAETQHQRLQETVLGMEFLLTYMIVLTYLQVSDNMTSLPAAAAVGVAYMTASMSFRGAFNPAYSLGRAFVVNNFDNLWIYWLGPLLGGLCAALCHEYIFNEQKMG